MDETNGRPPRQTLLGMHLGSEELADQERARMQRQSRWARPTETGRYGSEISLPPSAPPAPVVVDRPPDEPEGPSPFSQEWYDLLARGLVEQADLFAPIVRYLSLQGRKRKKAAKTESAAVLPA
jgi:hypothetical protein